MTPGPISEVPGFRRPEPQEERPTVASKGRIIDAVPGVGREDRDIPRPAAPDIAVPLTAVPLTAVPETTTPPADATTFATQPTPMPTEEPTQDAASAVPPPSPPLTQGVAEDIFATRVARGPAHLVLRWDDGTVLEATSPTVVGRDPVATGSEVAVALDDPSRSLSKTHARFTPGLMPTVEDLHSTNGVRIDRDGAAIAVVPGQPASLRHGDDVFCGTRRASVAVRA
jgi:hypothetical protein